MRTTLDIDPAVLSLAKDVAATSKQSVGAVISDFALRGIEATRAVIETTRNGFPVFSSSKSGQKMTLKKVKELLADEDLPI